MANAGTGYGNTGGYGYGAYKGQDPNTSIIGKSLSFLIEQYSKSYINTSTSSFATTPSVEQTISLITVPSGQISALKLIDQFDKGYING